MSIFHRIIVGGALLASLISTSTAQEQAIKGFYWFDFQTETHNFSPGAFFINTDGLSEGLHSLNAFVSCNDVLSPTQTSWFIKSYSLQPGVQYTTNIYIDGKYSSSEPYPCLLSTSPSPRDRGCGRMPSSA